MRATDVSKEDLFFTLYRSSNNISGTKQYIEPLLGHAMSHKDIEGKYSLLLHMACEP